MFSKGVYQVLVANNHSLVSCVSKMKLSQCKADLPTEKQMSCMGRMKVDVEDGKKHLFS